jgi:hypothetical protein
MVGTAQARLCPPYMSGPQPPAQNLNKSIDVSFVIIDVGRHTHSSQTRRDIDAFACQSFDEACRHSTLEGEAQYMRRPQMRFGHVDAEMPRTACAIRSVSIVRRCTMAGAPQSAIISMPIEAISIEMK